MKHAVIGLAVAVLATLAGCSAKDANDHNIKAAIEQYLAQGHQDFCLGMKTWPQEVTSVEMQMIQQFPDARAGKMAYLEHAGLLTHTEVKNAAIGLFSGNSLQYQLTAKGKTFQQASGDVCFAKQALVKLTEWHQETSSIVPDIVATYRYEAQDIAPWATAPAFKEVFTFEAERAFAPTPMRVTLRLNDSQWQVVEPVAE